MRNVNLFKLLVNAHAFGREGLTLQRRLFVFFLLFLLTVMIELLLVFFATGIFSAGAKESRIVLKNELQHICTDVERDMGTLAMQGLTLAGRLTEQIERKLEKSKLEPVAVADLSANVDLVLDGCYDILSAALERNKASAGFIVLDATVNPSLPQAESSRAGLFLKNMAPNVAYESPSAIRYMRGPSFIARERNIYLMPQWEMEFTTAPGDFFNTAMETARAGGKAASGLYYWNSRAKLAGDYTEAMLLTVPLIGSDGTVLGVCGFEMSDMLFKMQYTPDQAVFSRLFTMLAPQSGNGADASRALLAGSYTVTAAALDGSLSIGKERNGLFSFTGPNGEKYAGLYRPVNLYPADRVQAGEDWLLGILMPHEDFTSHIARQNQRILVLLITLFVLSAVAAFVLSHRYIAPVVDALRSITDKPGVDYAKTNIQEIDDLLAFLAEQDRICAPQEERLKQGEESSALFAAFVQGIESLSPAEKSVFNLYMEGYSAKQIAETLYLSINTIKTHNKRIYMKLNVSSRNELMVFVKMMKEKEGVCLPERAL